MKIGIATTGCPKINSFSAKTQILRENNFRDFNISILALFMVLEVLYFAFWQIWPFLVAVIF